MTHNNQSFLYVSYSWNFRHRLARYYGYELLDSVLVVLRGSKQLSSKDTSFSTDEDGASGLIQFIESWWLWEVETAMKMVVLEWCHVWLPRFRAVGLNVDLVQTSTFLASHLPPVHASVPVGILV